MPNNKKKWITFILFWLVVGGGVVYLLLWGFTKFVEEVVEPTTASASKKLNQWQFASVLSVCIVVLPIVFIPPLPFVWVIAMLYSMWIAFAIVQVSVTASMAVGYLLARRYLHKPAEKFLNRYKHVKAVLMCVDRAGPFRVALLIRLGPLPFTVENYVMAVPPSLTFLPYMLGSILGQLPGNLLGVYFGKNIKGLAAMMKGEKTSPGQMAYNIGGLLLSVVIVGAGFWYARRSIRRIEREQEEAKAVEELHAAQENLMYDHDEDDLDGRGSGAKRRSCGSVSGSAGGVWAVPRLSGGGTGAQPGAEAGAAAADGSREAVKASAKLLYGGHDPSSPGTSSGGGTIKAGSGGGQRGEGEDGCAGLDGLDPLGGVCRRSPTHGGGAGGGGALARPPAAVVVTSMTSLVEETDRQRLAGGAGGGGGVPLPGIGPPCGLVSGDSMDLSASFSTPTPQPVRLHGRGNTPPNATPLNKRVCELREGPVAPLRAPAQTGGGGGGSCGGAPPSPSPSEGGAITARLMSVASTGNVALDVVEHSLHGGYECTGAGGAGGYASEGGDEEAGCASPHAEPLAAPGPVLMPHVRSFSGMQSLMARKGSGQQTPGGGDDGGPRSPAHPAHQRLGSVGGAPPGSSGPNSGAYEHLALPPSPLRGPRPGSALGGAAAAGGAAAGAQRDGASCGGGAPGGTGLGQPVGEGVTAAPGGEVEQELPHTPNRRSPLCPAVHAGPRSAAAVASPVGGATTPPLSPVGGPKGGARGAVR